MAKKNRMKQQIVEDFVEPHPVTEDVHVKQKKLVGTAKLSKIVLKEKQKVLIDILNKNDITVVYGPAGTSKTFVDCFYAVESLKTHKFDKIIFTKPIQESGEKLGALPGDIAQKIDPFFESFILTLNKIIDKQNTERLIKSGVIECRPFAYMRGATFDNALMILDEAQNCDIRQLMLFATRMGKDSKVIISGDVSQSDIGREHVALQFFINMMDGVEGFGEFKFDREDIQRHKILIAMTDRYEQLKSENKLPKNKANG